MRVDNGTTDPVDFEQTGGGGDPQDPADSKQSKSGHLNPSGQSGDDESFTPAGKPNYTVSFENSNNKSQTATSAPFSNASATVTLNSDWTVSVS
ncbi:MAG: hypothetical protein AAF604_19535 [Acidobacteriota bacterium]